MVTYSHLCVCLLCECLSDAFSYGGPGVVLPSRLPVTHRTEKLPKTTEWWGKIFVCRSVYLFIYQSSWYVCQKHVKLLGHMTEKKRKERKVWTEVPIRTNASVTWRGKHKHKIIQKCKFWTEIEDRRSNDRSVMVHSEITWWPIMTGSFLPEWATTGNSMYHTRILCVGKHFCACRTLKLPE